MIIVAKKYGQLSNRLFQYAYFLAFAREHDIKIINPSFYDMAGYFSGTQQRGSFRSKSMSKVIKLLNDALLKLNVSNKLLSAMDFKSEDSDYNKELLLNGSLVFVSGWGFRDYENFNKHSDAIQDFFTPVKTHYDSVNNLIREVRKRANIIVGVHIRRTDYADYAGGKYYHDDDFYAHFMNEMKSLLALRFPEKRVGFLICSDEEINRDYFDNQFGTVFLGTHHFIEDLYALSKCDFLLGPPSTFSMWASFFGKVPLLFLESKDVVIKLENFKASN